MGMYIPNVSSVNPAATSSIFLSRNGCVNALGDSGRGDGVKRARIVKLAMISRNRITNAPARIAHPNPTSGINRCSMMGKMTPPILDPLDIMPYAVPRFLANHPGITLVASVIDFRQLPFCMNVPGKKV